MESLTFDLLQQPATSVDTPRAAGAELAARVFREQLAKAGIPLELVAQARVQLSRGTRREGIARGQHVEGFDLTFTADATMDTGRRYERDRVLFVAPHDPGRELRRRA